MKASLLGVIAALLVSFITPLAAESDPAVRTVSVSGTAVTRTTPDLIVWQITTSDFDRDLLLAKGNSDKKLNAILSLRDELGIKAEDLETGHVSIHREYEQDERGRRGAFKHFAVSRHVTIRQRDLKSFDQFFSRLVRAAEMEVSLSFESSNLETLREETRLKALRIARDKAKAMAEELGSKLGKVLTINEHGNPAPSSLMFSNAYFADPNASSAVDISSGTFSPGAIEVRVTVYAVFEIE
jgi:uncharacterized protein YggE